MVIGRWYRTILRLWYDQDVVAGLDIVTMERMVCNVCHSNDANGHNGNSERHRPSSVEDEEQKIIALPDVMVEPVEGLFVNQ